MTPVEHLAEAERLLTDARGSESAGLAEQQTADALTAIGHALVAIADIAGVAHSTGTVSGNATT